MRRIWLGLFAAFLLPYVVTLAWSARMQGEAGHMESSSSGRRVYLERGQTGYLDLEEYLVGVVARQMPADYELEALKAQAVIARTYIYRQMGEKPEIRESELKLERLAETQMESLWGRDHFLEYYKKVQEAVKETRGLVIVFEGELAEPLFHRASAGATRNGDEAHPYLKSVDSQEDVEAEGYLTILEWTPAELADKFNQMAWNGNGIAGGSYGISGGGAAGGGADGNGGGAGEAEGSKAAEGGEGTGGSYGISGGLAADRGNGVGNLVQAGDIPDTIQLVSREESGYVAEIQIGSHVYTGDQVRVILGLPSPCFTLEAHEGQVRAVCEGIGHGYGLSQFGADHMAKEGKTAQEILKHYYQNIEIISWDS